MKITITEVTTDTNDENMSMLFDLQPFSHIQPFQLEITTADLKVDTKQEETVITSPVIKAYLEKVTGIKLHNLRIIWFWDDETHVILLAADFNEAVLEWPVKKDAAGETVLDRFGKPQFDYEALPEETGKMSENFLYCTLDYDTAARQLEKQMQAAGIEADVC
jgi:hypothetical protein